MSEESNDGEGSGEKDGEPGGEREGRVGNDDLFFFFLSSRFSSTISSTFCSSCCMTAEGGREIDESGDVDGERD